jgi:hypothetical protein
MLLQSNDTGELQVIFAKHKGSPKTTDLVHDVAAVEGGS